MLSRRRWRFDGRVQGVGFRAFCEEAALSRGIRGWVRNEFDGSVSLEAEGEVDVLADLLNHVRTSHLLARVDRTEEIPLTPKNDPAEMFIIR
ncbi:MAG: acylphosphatase [Elusimicrobia bacterium]|jgi:acylphosphatase|nr:acylphosphatase [Elusimicrobiota bacterium]